MLALLGKSVDIAEPPPSDEDWYANVLWLERAGACCHTRRYALLRFHSRRSCAEFRPLGTYVVGVIEEALRSERLPADALGSLEPDALQVLRTASRSVLGFMNDMAVHIDYANASAGGLSHCDPDAISRQFRRTPSNRGGYLYPIDLVSSAPAAPSRARSRTLN